MKTIKTLCLTALSLLMLACTQSVRYSIDVDLTPFQPAGLKVDSIIFTSNGQVFHAVDSLPDYKVRVDGEVSAPSLAEMTIWYSMDDESGNAVVPLILEEGKITFDVRDGFAKGTPQNDAVYEFRTNLNPDSCVTTHYFTEFVEKHKGQLCVAAVMAESVLTYYVEVEDIENAMNTLTEEQKQYVSIKALREKLDNIKRTSEGQKFVDFEAEYDGKVQHLSDYVGKGRYVLVDFWASWCAPCRAEIPHIINVYSKYAGVLDVVGVATWDEPDKTIQAIADLGITYPQIMNAQNAGSDAYSIDGIPEIILFGPDGTILKRGLRGEQIEATVKEYLDKQ